MSNNFARYQLNLSELIKRLSDNQHPHLFKAYTLQNRLTENIEAATLYGQTDDNRAERMRILEQLNELAMGTCNLPFSDIYPITVHLSDSESEKTHILESDFIRIEAGSFVMGAIFGMDPYAKIDEHPIHSVYVRDFAITRTTITNVQYALFINDTNHHPPLYWSNKRPPLGKGNHPVVNVTLDDALAYCEWMKQLFKQPFTLPSEAEWEKAARGEYALTYPWGYQWEDAHANTLELNKRDTMPVYEMSIGQSKYGLLHMSGNVFEWTRTIWGVDDENPKFTYPYQADDGREDLKIHDDVYRIVRGGAFNTSAKSARTTARSRYRATIARPDIGFRIITYASS